MLTALFEQKGMKDTKRNLKFIVLMTIMSNSPICTLNWNLGIINASYAL